jgi:HK97 family phage prohead protease
MPLPQPHQDEAQDDFIGRCVQDDAMKAEFPDNDQRLKVCYDLWKKKKETKAMAKELRNRSFPLEEVRINGGKRPRIEGFAAVYDSFSEDLFGGYRERIKPGAFTKTLKDGPEVKGLFNHNPDAILGSRKAGTLVLEERPKGLWMQIEPPETSTGKDVVELMKRGDLDECSFAFIPVKDRWSKDEAGDQIRDLLEVRLLDVSIVAYGAYKEPQAYLQRAILENDFALDLDNLIPAMMRARTGKANGEDEARIHVARTTLDMLLKGNRKGDFSRINKLIRGE